jgi:cobalt-zinc-cadmium efflux system outer membrane protein
MSVRVFRQFAASCAAVVVVFQATVHTQEARPSAVAHEFISAERGWSLTQLVATALERSPSVLAARARVEAARGEQLQAGLRPNPSVMSDFREQIGGTDRLTMVGLSWPLDLFRKPGRTDVANSGVEIADNELRNTERVLAAAVRSKTLQLTAAVQQVTVREQVAQTLAQLRDLLAARADSGAAPPLARDIADVDARRAAAEVLRQRAVAEATLSELKALIGLQPGESLLLRDDLEQLSKLPELSEARLTTTTAPQTTGERADVQLAGAQIRAAIAGLSVIRLSAKPDVTLNTSYMRMSSGFPLFGLNALGAPAPIQGVFHNVSIGAMVTLPFRDRRQGDVAAATALVTAAQRGAEATRLSANAEVAAAKSRVKRLDEALGLYSGGLRDLALKNVEVMRGSYQLGRATLLDVLTETRRLLDTETAYTDLLLETLQARSDLATAMGVIR